ncbi:MAG: hypothetical protein N2745_02270 [Syntrophorhabdaceae bacterium]|nr:hypothetical protein [Syntrophorhabdaceae bacterium]
MKEFFTDLFIDLYENFSDIFLNVIVMVIVMIAGFIITWFIKKVFEKLLVLFRFDKWAKDVGIVNFLEKGGVKSQPSTILSKIVYWILIIAFFSFGMNFIGIYQFTEYASRISNAFPSIVISVIIIIMGIIFSNFLSRVVYMTCENANIKYGDFIGKGVRVFFVIITFGVVFEYIGVGNTIITISFLIVFGGVILSLSLALGIGLSNVLGDLIKELVKQRTSKKDREDLGSN